MPNSPIDESTQSFVFQIAAAAGELFLSAREECIFDLQKDRMACLRYVFCSFTNKMKKKTELLVLLFAARARSPANNSGPGKLRSLITLMSTERAARLCGVCAFVAVKSTQQTNGKTHVFQQAKPNR